MPTYRRPTRLGRPLGPWDRTPAGLRAALISTPILLVLFLVNSVGIAIFSSTTVPASLICYPIQLLAYVLNGFIAGAQARSSYNKATRTVGQHHEVVRSRHPNYAAQGALAGVVLGIVGIIVYFLVGAAATTLIPGVGLLLTIAAAPMALFLIVDFALCVGAGIIGGLIYGRFS